MLETLNVRLILRRKQKARTYPSFISKIEILRCEIVSFSERYMISSGVPSSILRKSIEFIVKILLKLIYLYYTRTFVLYARKRKQTFLFFRKHMVKISLVNMMFGSFCIKPRFHKPFSYTERFLKTGVSEHLQTGTLHEPKSTELLTEPQKNGPVRAVVMLQYYCIPQLSEESAASSSSILSKASLE
jgi:hypothetical protein